MKSYRYNHHTESKRSKLIFSRWFLKIIRFYFYHDNFRTFEGKNPYWTKLAKVGLFQHHNHKLVFFQTRKVSASEPLWKQSIWFLVSVWTLTEQMTEDQLLVLVWGFRKQRKTMVRACRRTKTHGKKLWNSCVFVQILLWGPLNSSVRAINPRGKISVRNLLDGLRRRV